MIRLPFLLQRPALLLRDLLVNREEPDLERLASVQDAESFLWRILPHAARTFSACIALLPAPLARASAVAYLYCRCLDSYEDLLPEHSRREDALRAFAERFQRHSSLLPAAAPALDPYLAQDARDQAHILLVNRCRMVDQVFHSLAPPIQGIIIDLVKGMAEGMVWSSAVFEQQKGVLVDAEQLSRYCGYVLGLPAVFAARLLHFHHRKDPQITPGQREDALLVGEMVQLANITRDIEKDLLRGIAYDPRLGDVLGLDVDGDADLGKRVRQVRQDFLLRALKLAPAYRRFSVQLDFTRFSFGRASAVLMLLFTDRYYRSCARRVGLQDWKGPRTGFAVLLQSLPATFSSAWANRIIRRTEKHFLEFVRTAEGREADLRIEVECAGGSRQNAKPARAEISRRGAETRRGGR